MPIVGVYICLGIMIIGAASVVLVNSRGLTVDKDTELRKKLRDAKVFYQVCAYNKYKYR